MSKPIIKRAVDFDEVFAFLKGRYYIVVDSLYVWRDGKAHEETGRADHYPGLYKTREEARRALRRFNAKAA